MTSDPPRRHALLRLDEIPNFLTALRILIALAFPFVPRGARLALVAVAALTEFFDGVLARRFSWESRAGRLLDPLADKLLFAAMAATFLVEGSLSWLGLVALGIRDLVVLLGSSCLIVLRRWRPFLRMAPSFVGKLTTAIQYAAFLLLLLDHPLPLALVILALVAGSLSALQIVRQFFRSPS